MADGDTIPDAVCSKCGSGLVAVRMTVESVERFCPQCELHGEWREPIYTYEVEVRGIIPVVATNENEAEMIIRKRIPDWLKDRLTYEVTRP